MDALLLPLRSTCPAISSHTVCRKGSGSTQSRSDRVLLSSSYSHVRTNLSASFKGEDQRQLRSGKGRRSLRAKAKIATEEEGVNEAELAVEEEAVNEPEPAVEEAEDAAPTNSGSDDAIAQSVALLKTAAKTRKVRASEIITAFKVLAKAKIDPTDFLPIIGGTKSPGRTWLLVFTSNKDEYNSSEGRGKYFPVTAVQNFDAEAMFIENGVYLGPLAELTFNGNFSWEKRNLRFIFHTLNVKIGPFGPFRISVGSKDQEITKTSPGFIWSYADDEILVGMGKAGGTAFWVRCERVKKPLY